MEYKEIRDYQRELVNLFKNNKKKLDSIITYHEKELGQKFVKDVVPHYYSGNLEKAKYLFLTLNPVLSDFSYKQNNIFLNTNNKGIDDYCYNWFNKCEGQVRTFTFTRCNKLAETLNRSNYGGQFKALHKTSVIVDLVPFFSKTTSFKHLDVKHGLGKELWERIYNYGKTRQAVFLIGAPYKKMFNSIPGKVEKEATTQILVSKKYNRYSIVSLKKKKNVYFLSHACSARGMNDYIFKEFIPQNFE